MSILHPDVRNWILVMTMFFTCTTYGQYHVKPFDISKQITALEKTEEGYILYGTIKGEYGIYDGLQFNRIDNLNAAIRSIEIDENVAYLSTGRGLYEEQDRKIIQISRNNLDVLGKSKDNSFLVTTEGVFEKVNSDYSPTKEDFFDINDIEYGSYFKIGDREYFRADKKVFAKTNGWIEVITHPEADFSIVPLNSSKMIIVDRKALITFDTEGYVDTLLHLNVENANKVFKLSGSDLLLCSNDSIGIFNIRKRELDNFYRLKTDLISSVTEDVWGNVWIAAGSYIYQVIDRTIDQRNQTPKVSIESIRINGIRKEIASTFRLNEEVNEIEVDFSGVQLTHPQNLEFQTMFSSEDHVSVVANGEWSPPIKERNVEYRNLKPGKYIFQLRGTVDGKYFMYTKPIEFNVEDDVIQSIWLIGILGALAILLIALYFNNRYNSLKRKSLQDRNRLVQENKMLTLQQKALQLQMNPHFVFNSLNSIQGLIAKEDNQKARRYLQEFSTMMRSVLNQSREETILLSDETKYLKSYLNLEQMANNEKFDWDIKIAPDVEDDVRIPTMIIQPFVENAILHGVKTLKDRRGKIELTFEMQGTKIICKVTDNGIGRAAAAALRSSNHKSVAIDVVKERLRSKLKSSQSSPIQYTDILYGEQKVGGTEVTLLIPIMN